MVNNSEKSRAGSGRPLRLQLDHLAQAEQARGDDVGIDERLDQILRPA